RRGDPVGRFGRGAGGDAQGDQRWLCPCRRTNGSQQLTPRTFILHIPGPRWRLALVLAVVWSDVVAAMRWMAAAGALLLVIVFFIGRMRIGRTVRRGAHFGSLSARASAFMRSPARRIISRASSVDRPWRAANAASSRR